MALPKIVSLFSGAGGLDLGYRDAGFALAFAVDSSEWAIKTHKRNFKDSTSIAADLIDLQPAGVLEKLADVLTDGEPIGVIGGPPCQGFSRANPAALASDPRNKLPILYLEIVEELQKRYDVRFVLFENVLGIKDVKHEIAFKGILAKFKQLGFAESMSIVHSTSRSRRTASGSLSLLSSLSRRGARSLQRRSLARIST